MRRTMLCLALPVLLGPAPAAWAGQEPATRAPATEIGPVEPGSAAAGQSETRELTVTVGTGGGTGIGGERRRFVVEGPRNLLDLDETARAQVVGGHLLVFTRAVLAVFDLASGEKVLGEVAAPGVVASRDGRRVAFEALQRRFTPPEASSSVVEALDVTSLAVEPVFPDRSVIRPAQLGGLVAWIEDPLERHSAGKLVFSPDGERLAFFCTHVRASPGGLQRVFLVVIDLSKGVSGSVFVHVPFDWTAHLEPGVDLGETTPYFAVESLTWSGSGALIVHPPASAWWLQEEIIVPLPGAEVWGTQAHGS